MKRIILIVPGDNDLQAFTIDAPLQYLENLDLAENNLTSFDISSMPALRILALDKNNINRTDSIKGCHKLQVLSCREQACGSHFVYQDCDEIQDLILSNNSITCFAPSTQFLNLQRLELASTGLQTLIPEFGIRCPNLRVINFNYNALRDLRPMLGISKLQKLYLAGNRIARLRRTTVVLDRLSKELIELDLRNNPLTVGFYTPQDQSDDGQRTMVVHGKGQSPATPDEDPMSHAPKAYLLPPLDTNLDNASRQRLDEDTKLRRRVYEMLLVNGCKRLRHLDGLEVDRGMVGNKDGVWARLVELGVLKSKGTGSSAQD